jgi:hypothetical protein
VPFLSHCYHGKRTLILAARNALLSMIDYLWK